MGVLQCGFPAEIDAVSSPQVSPRWFEALGEQDRVLPFPELVNAALIFVALCQEALLFLLWLRPKQNRLPLVSSRLHHWLRLPPVPILKEQSSQPLLRVQVFLPYGN